MQTILKRCFCALVLTILGISQSPAIAGYVLTVTVQDNNGTATFTDTVGTTLNGFQNQNGVVVSVMNSGTAGQDAAATMMFSYDDVNVGVMTLKEQIGPSSASLGFTAGVNTNFPVPGQVGLVNGPVTVSVTLVQDGLTLPAISPNVGLILSGGGVSGDGTRLSLAYNGANILNSSTPAANSFSVSPSGGLYGSAPLADPFSLALTDTMTFNQPGQSSMGGFMGTAVVAEPGTLAILLSGLPLIAIRRGRRRKAAA